MGLIDCTLAVAICYIRHVWQAGCSYVALISLSALGCQYEDLQAQGLAFPLCGCTVLPELAQATSGLHLSGARRLPAYRVQLQVRSGKRVKSLVEFLAAMW